MLGISELNLLNKKALVVGGTRGIGLSIAKAYHQLGADVVIWGRSKAGKEVAESLSTEEAKVNFVPVDLMKTDSFDKFIKITRDYLGGKIDILVNSAGTQFRSAALNYPEEKWREILEINLNAVFFCFTESC